MEMLTVSGWRCAFTRSMRRLEILVLALNIALVPPVLAQTTGKPPTRIGFIGNADPKTQAQSLAALRQGLRELGWIEGENLNIEYRWAEGNMDRLSGFAAELARLKWVSSLRLEPREFGLLRLQPAPFQLYSP